MLLFFNVYVFVILKEKLMWIPKETVLHYTAETKTVFLATTTRISQKSILSLLGNEIICNSWQG